MADFRAVTPDFSVSAQISPADVALARAQGFSLIINNRPDGEAPDQPAASDIEAAAAREDLAYAHIPVTGRPSAAQAEAVRSAVEGAHGAALAFCRTGNRSIAAWALGELAAGTTGRDELIRLAAAAGYDLGGVLPRQA
jgi:uncharacterized protein (TIGR01244 family)